MTPRAYTALWMLDQVKAKVDSTDPTLEALKLLPIPELKEDLSNYDHWYHAVVFHLEYYGLDDLVHEMKNEYPDGPQPEDLKTWANWQRWQRHCLHAYSIIYSRATKVIEQASMYEKGHPTPDPYYCPHDLLKTIEEYKKYKEYKEYKESKESKIPKIPKRT